MNFSKIGHSLYVLHSDVSIVNNINAVLTPSGFTQATSFRIKSSLSCFGFTDLDSASSYNITIGCVLQHCHNAGCACRNMPPLWRSQTADPSQINIYNFSKTDELR